MTRDSDGNGLKTSTFLCHWQRSRRFHTFQIVLRIPPISKVSVTASVTSRCTALTGNSLIVLKQGAFVCSRFANLARTLLSLPNGQ